MLLKHGVARETRGLKCYELTEPFMFKITNPVCRICTIPERNWFKALPYAESLWLASGRNDMDFITHYLPHMAEYSDDGIFMRGGYGPRLRFYDGGMADYKIRIAKDISAGYTDQFRYVVDCFKKDSYTRRAVINIGDPVKDDFDENGNLKETKDIPCSRSIQFMRNVETGKLDMTVLMRSNDIMWGASAVNIFNFTFMQEYFSAIFGLEVGSYYHIANNFHYYENFRSQLEQIAYSKPVDEVRGGFKKSFHSLEGFDALVAQLSEAESKMRMDIISYDPTMFEDEFFQNWHDVLYRFNLKRANNNNVSSG